MQLRLLFTTLTFAASICMHAQNSSPYWSLAGNSNVSATASKLGTTNAVPVRFFVNNMEQGRIHSNGLWAIGGQATDAKLTVSSAAGAVPFRVRIGTGTKLIVNSNGGVAIGTLSAAPTDGLYVKENVGIGTAAPTQKLHVVGNAAFSGNVGIGTTSPAVNAHVVHGIGNGASYGLRIQPAGYAQEWTWYSSTGGQLWLFHNGLFRGTFDPTSGAYTATSDRRLKQDFEAADISCPT